MEEGWNTNTHQSTPEPVRSRLRIPLDAFTMAGIVKDAGLSIEEFKKLL